MQDRFKNISNLPDNIQLGVDNWSFGKGGHGLKDWQWIISQTHDDLSQDIYVMPDIICEVLDRTREWGKDEIRNEIHRILEIR